jgi:hypothetical protein
MRPEERDPGYVWDMLDAARAVREFTTGVPAHQTAPLVAGRMTVQFPAATCRTCPMRDACTTAAEGRSISLHPQEALLQALRATLRTSDERADLRHP